MSKSIETVVNDFLSLTVATHKRRCCIKHNVRTNSEIECQDHAKHWNISRHWCDNCGATLKEIVEGKK